MIFETILVIILILLIFSSYFDIKTFEVPYLCSISIFVLSIFSLLYQNNIKTHLIAGLICFIIGWLFAEFNIWGGADSQLLISMGFLFGFSIFFVWFCCIAIIYAMMFLLFIKNVKNPPFVPVFLFSYILTVML